METRPEAGVIEDMSGDGIDPLADHNCLLQMPRSRRPAHRFCCIAFTAPIGSANPVRQSSAQCRWLGWKSIRLRPLLQITRIDRRTTSVMMEKKRVFRTHAQRSASEWLLSAVNDAPPQGTIRRRVRGHRDSADAKHACSLTSKLGAKLGDPRRVAFCSGGRKTSRSDRNLIKTYCPPLRVGDVTSAT